MSAYVVITPPFCFCYFVVFSASQDYFVTVCYRIHFFFSQCQITREPQLKNRKSQDNELSCLPDSLGEADMLPG